MLIFDVSDRSEPRFKWRAVQELIERGGLSVIPVKDKKPLLELWKDFQERSPTLAELTMWMRRWPDADFAVLTGRRFIAVDLDTDEAIAFAASELPTTPMKQKTPRGEHWFYSVDSSVSANSAGAGVDIRASGGYLVMQPSTGYQLSWDERQGPPDFDRLPALSREDVLAIDAFRNGQKPFRSGNTVVKGERNSTITKYVGGMVSDGLLGEELLSKALKANELFEPPLDVPEVAAVVRSIERRERQQQPRLVTRGHTFDQLVQADLPEPRWLVDYFLPEGTSILVGPPKSGKSALLEYLATQVTGTVLYFAFEYNKPMLQKRVKKLAKSGIRGDNIRFFSREEPSDAGMKPLKFIKEVISQINPVAVFVDTLATVKRENQGNYDSEYGACAELIELASKNGANLVVVHHSKKRTKDFDETLIEKVLGSTAIAASFDNVLGYSRHDGVSCLKGQGRLIDDFAVDLTFEEGRFKIDRDGNLARQRQRANMPEASKLLTLLQRGPAKLSELHEFVNSERGDSISKSNVANQVKLLIEKGLVIKPAERGGAYSISPQES